MNHLLYRSGKLLILAQILALCAGNLVAQQPTSITFDRITSENIVRVKGLSQNTVYTILQDSRGFMWFGTWDGLNKYDGYSFTVFNKENGLCFNTIRCLLEDDKKNLWVGTEGGLNRMNLLTGEISSFKHDPGVTNSISDNFITCLLEDKDSNLWICTPRGLNRFDEKLQVFTRFTFYSKEADSSHTNYIHKIFQDKDGFLWIGTKYGLHKFDPAAHNFVSYYFSKEKSARYLANDVLDMIQDNQGILWIGTRIGIYRMDPLTEKWYGVPSVPGGKEQFSSEIINALFFDSSGNLWIGTNNQLIIYNPETAKIVYYKNTNSNTSISNDDILCIYRDQVGTIWIGTYKGVNKVDQSPSRFTHYYYNPDVPNSLSNNIVYAILEDKQGLIWVATYGGLNILDRETEKFSVLHSQPGNPNSLAEDKLKALYLDDQGYIWIGTESCGLDRYDRKSRSFTHFRHDPTNPSSISSDRILCFAEDPHGKLWIGTERGVNIYDPSLGSFTYFGHSLRDTMRLSNDTTWTIYQDRHAMMWVGTDNGLDRVDLINHRVESFKNDPADPKSISNNRIFSIYEDSAGIFWIGTVGGGLNRFDPASGDFRSYTEAQGLPNNVVYATLEDREGNLWMSTNWGLSKFNKITETFVNYDIKDGVQDNEFNANAYFLSKGGKMFFGGMNGFNIFDPQDIKLNKNQPRIVLTGFKIFNEPVEREFADGDTITLKYNDNFFTFEFSALDYTNPSKNKFRYKLEHYDLDWIPRDADQRYADYKKVSPGIYTFMVTGSNNDGVWNTKGISLEVIITPPWWQTWMFRIPLFIIVIALGWSLVYLRIKIIKRKHAVEKKMLDIEKQIFELEQKALRLQINPHFIFNSLNAIQNFVISNDTDKAVSYLAKFSHLMRMILANSTESYIPLRDELRALTYYLDLEKLRFDQKFEYLIEVDPKIDQDFVEIPPMLFQPYVENAIIHGLVHSEKTGHLNIILKLIKDNLLCIIQDDGVGRKRGSELRELSGIKRQPRGMIITQERIDLLNKQSRKSFSVNVIDLMDKEGKPAGTRIEILIHFKES